jgi:hypothetical protein
LPLLQNFSRSLQFLRKSEDSTDLRFNCVDGRSKKPKSVMAHKAIFGPHSKLLKELFDIAKAEMVRKRLKANVQG